MSLLVAGDVPSFDRGAFTAALASRLSVNAESITLHVSGASVAVTAHVIAPADDAAADSILQAMVSLVATPAEASAALGVSVQSISASPSRAVATLLLSPPPPSSTLQPAMPPPVSPLNGTDANEFGAGNTGALIGGIVGGVVGVLLIIMCCVVGFCVCRARRASHKEPTYSSGVGPRPSLPSGIYATSSAHHVISLDIDHEHSVQPGPPGAPPPPPGAPPPPLFAPTDKI